MRANKNGEEAIPNSFSRVGDLAVQGQLYPGSPGTPSLAPFPAPQSKQPSHTEVPASYELTLTELVTL